MQDFWTDLHPDLRAIALVLVAAAILGTWIVVTDVVTAMRASRDARDRELDTVIGRDQHRAESRSRLRRLQAKFRRSA